MTSDIAPVSRHGMIRAYSQYNLMSSSLIDFAQFVS